LGTTSFKRSKATALVVTDQGRVLAVATPERTRTNGTCTMKNELTVKLPAEMKPDLEQLVKTGPFESVDEVVRYAIDLFLARTEYRQLVASGKLSKQQLSRLRYKTSATELNRRASRLKKSTQTKN